MYLITGRLLEMTSCNPMTVVMFWSNFWISGPETGLVCYLQNGVVQKFPILDYLLLVLYCAVLYNTALYLYLYPCSVQNINCFYYVLLEIYNMYYTILYNICGIFIRVHLYINCLLLLLLLFTTCRTISQDANHLQAHHGLPLPPPLTTSFLNDFEFLIVPWKENGHCLWSGSRTTFLC